MNREIKFRIWNKKHLNNRFGAPTSEHVDCGKKSIDIEIIGNIYEGRKNNEL